MDIPNDIIRHILLQLPVKSVIQCQCVCKEWRSLIQDSDFKRSYRGQERTIIIFSHKPKSWDSWKSKYFVRSTSHDLRLQRHKQPFGEAYHPLIRASYKYCVKLCSCDGLVLVVAERDILLWNPSTRSSTKVLERPYPEDSNSVLIAGLCYDSYTRDYKAVLLLHRSEPSYHDLGHNPLFVISASLKHKEWRPVHFPYSFGCTRDGVDFRNTFHWWVTDFKGWDWDFSWGDRIVYFDPVRDEFRILPTPELRENSLIGGLGVIDECLCMAVCMVEEEEEKPKPKKIQVMIMKEYGRQESWMTAFAIQISELGDLYYASYGLTFYSQKKNAQQILFQLKWSCGGRQVYVYDWKKDELKKDMMDFLTSRHRYFVNMCFYVESLACTDTNGLI